MLSIPLCVSVWIFSVDAVGFPCFAELWIFLLLYAKALGSFAFSRYFMHRTLCTWLFNWRRYSISPCYIFRTVSMNFCSSIVHRIVVFSPYVGVFVTFFRSTGVWLVFFLISRWSAIKLPSVLTLLVGRQERHPADIGCWHGCLSGVRCRLAYVPADATTTHCLLLQ